MDTVDVGALLAMVEDGTLTCCCCSCATVVSVSRQAVWRYVLLAPLIGCSSCWS